MFVYALSTGNCLVEVLHGQFRSLKHIVNIPSIVSRKDVDIAVSLVDFHQKPYAGATKPCKHLGERFGTGTKILDTLWKLPKPFDAVTQFRLVQQGVRHCC